MKRILRYFRSRRFESELKAEMQAHLEERIDDLVEAGLTPERARIEALRQFGNRTHLAEECHEKWSFGWLDELGQNLRFALRMLARNPVFATVSILSLALGIGANSVIFGAVDQVLLRSLPYRQPGDLFAVWGHRKDHNGEPMHVSAADFYDWRAQSRAFESLSAYSSWPMNLTNVEDPRRLETQLVSANLFSTLGVNAQIGRVFRSDEDQEQSAPVVILSHRLWRELGESPELIGRQLTLNGSSATVVGVMPASFAFPIPETDAWVPLSLSEKNRANRDGRWLSVIGRLSGGSNARNAATEMDLIAQRLAAVYPASNTGWSVNLVPLHEQFVGKTRPFLLMLQGAAALLLLITCANLANLLLARGSSRAKEIAVRAALGANRARIFRQLLGESLVLATFGGILGFALAVPGIEFARKFGSDLIPRASEVHLNLPIALFAMGMTLATVVIFGLMPAIHATRSDLAERIGSASRGTPRHMEHKRGVLIVIEVGLASVLLVAAGLLGESFARLQSTPTGLRTDHLLTMRMTLPVSRYPTNTSQNSFFDQVLTKVRDLPGVLAVGEISDTPLKGNNPTFEFAAEGVTRRANDPPIQAGLRAISTGYLQTARIPILKGRDFENSDRAGSAPVAIINQAMALRYFPGLDPIGRRLRVKDEQEWITIAGLVPDVKHMGLTENEGPVVYIPYEQKTQGWLAWTTLMVRTGGEPLSFAPAVRGAIRQIDKSQPVSEVGTLDEVLSRSTAIPRFSASIFTILAGLALLIAVIGVYGLLVYTVAQRFLELSIRLALGASPIQVSLLMLRQSMLRVLLGVVGGLLFAGLLTRYVQSMLFGVGPHDPVIFAAVAFVLLVSSLGALLVPVWRIFRMDPAAALRAE